jgi:hypothetical protein
MGKVYVTGVICPWGLRVKRGQFHGEVSHLRNIDEACLLFPSLSLGSLTAHFFVTSLSEISIDESEKKAILTLYCFSAP